MSKVLYVIIAEHCDDYCGRYDVIGYFTSKEKAELTAKVHNHETNRRLQKEGLPSWSNQWEFTLYVVKEVHNFDEKGIQNENELEYKEVED